jgi:hypothetical protein
MAYDLTASDIAKHIQRPGEPLTAAVDRFRNWTKMGIIRPRGDRHPGTGRHNRYTFEALVDAVLLQTLVDTFGSPASGVRSWLDQATKMVRHRIATGDLNEWVLVASRYPDGVGLSVVKSKDLGKHISESKFDAHMVLNLNQLWERVKSVRDDNRIKEAEKNLQSLKEESLKRKQTIARRPDPKTSKS